MKKFISTLCFSISLLGLGASSATAGTIVFNPLQARDNTPKKEAKVIKGFDLAVTEEALQSRVFEVPNYRINGNLLNFISDYMLEIERTKGIQRLPEHFLSCEAIRTRMGDYPSFSSAHGA